MTILSNSLCKLKVLQTYVSVRSRQLTFSGPSILISRYAGLGDVICSIPTVKAIRSQNPKSFIAFQTYEPFTPIIQTLHEVNLVIGHQTNIAPYFNQIHHLKGSDEGSSHISPKHIVDEYAELTKVVLKDRQPKIPSIPQKFQDLATQLLPTPTKLRIAVHTGPTWKVREWKPQFWDILATQLICNLDVEIIQIGTDAIVNAAPRKAHRVKGAIDCIKEQNILITAAILQSCHLLIGIDSGLLHLAGAIGTPTVGLFGAINPNYRLPPNTPSSAATSSVPCLGCHHKQPPTHWQTNCPHQIRCMNELTPLQVFNLAKHSLANIKIHPKT